MLKLAEDPNLQIENYVEILSTDPTQQIWQFLHVFHDLERTERLIRHNFHIGEDKHKQHIRKQSQQISYCLKQAEEYFFAASQVGIATKPLLLYYGAVSLARSLILLRNNGEYSLDYMRTHKRHNHHGLELHGDIDGSLRQSPFNLLTEASCSIYFNQESKPWGTFGLFYRSLAPSAAQIDINVYDSGKSGYLRWKLPSSSPLPELKVYQDTSMRLFYLLLQCPDMVESIRYFVGSYVAFPLHRVRVEATANLIPETDKMDFVIDYYVNDILTEQDHEVLTKSGLKLVEKWGSNYVYQDTYSSRDEGADNEESQNVDSGYFLVEDLTGQKYLHIPFSGFLGPYVPEPAAFYILIFSFGWLARYYPDIWLKAMDDITVREVIEKFSEVFTRKFPLFILDQLTLTKHNIHA